MIDPISNLFLGLLVNLFDIYVMWLYPIIGIAFQTHSRNKPHRNPIKTLLGIVRQLP